LPKKTIPISKVAFRNFLTELQVLLFFIIWTYLYVFILLCRTILLVTSSRTMSPFTGWLFAWTSWWTKTRTSALFTEPRYITVAATVKKRLKEDLTYLILSREPNQISFGWRKSLKLFRFFSIFAKKPFHMSKQLFIQFKCKLQLLRLILIVFVVVVKL
jgi:hypothetical protein